MTTLAAAALAALLESRPTRRMGLRATAAPRKPEVENRIQKRRRKRDAADAAKKAQRRRKR